MAIGTASDFKIYEEEFQTGLTETLVQESNIFNAASNGAIRLITNEEVGNYRKEAFFKAISSLVSRRDTTSVASVTDTALTQDEAVAVKLMRRIGPVANTLDSLRKIASDQSEFSYLLGQQIGKAVAVDYANAAIMAGNAAISGQAALNYDYSATDTPTHGALVSTLAKFGDAAQRIVAWVMHSKSYFDLVGQSISDKITNVADVTIYEGTAATLGRPAIVTDATSLITAGTPDTYHILGLVDSAITITETEGREIVSEVVTGLENLVFRVQGEHAFTVGIKGFAWDVTNGGANPSDAALATATNWDKVATDDKDLAGVRLTAQ